MIKQWILDSLPDELYLKIIYKRRMGEKLNLLYPQTFNEKLQWLKLYDRKPEYTIMVDKYEAKKWVEKKIGKEYIIPLLGVWDKFQDIDFELLPRQFVLKCTHDSGSLVVIKDKLKFDKDAVSLQFSHNLKINYYFKGREWPYKNIKPRIIAEEYLTEEMGDLKDYKFFCFNGKVEFFKIDFNRFIYHQANYYNVDGEILPFGEQVCPPDFNKELDMPYNLKEMIRLAEKLSKNITFVRVDFYEVDKKVFFGEMTFYPASGMGKFLSHEMDYELGKKIVL